MEKKLWSNAELLELGVENTKDDCESIAADMCLDPQNHFCQYCGEFFIKHSAKEKHEKTCPKKPQDPVIPPLS